MKVKELDDFNSPNRKPWLIVVLVVVAILLFLWRENVHKADVERRIEESSNQFTDVESVPVVETAEMAVALPETTVAELIVDPSDMLSRAKLLQEKKQLPSARKVYLRLLQMNLDSETRLSVEESLAAINIELIMTPYSIPEKTEYVVKSGDFCDRIAKKHGTTVDLIAKSNNLTDPGRIMVGDVLRVFAGTFKAVVSKSNIDMVIYMNDSFFKRYSVGTGKFGKTPVGTFVIADKQKEPVWWHPSGRSYQFGDAENILGTRWMSIKATGDTPDVRGYGIHGTWLPESIGKAESAGCVRMRNEDVEELYTYLPVGTVIEIVE